MIRANSRIGTTVYISTIEVDFETGKILDDLLESGIIINKPASGYFLVQYGDNQSRVIHQAFLYETMEGAIEAHDTYITSLMKKFSKSSAELLGDLRRRLINES